MERVAIRDLLRAALSRHQIDLARCFPSPITRQPLQNVWGFHRRKIYLTDRLRKFLLGFKQIYTFRGLDEPTAPSTNFARSGSGVDALSWELPLPFQMAVA